MSPSREHNSSVGKPATQGVNPRVLVTGASGFLGGYVLARLAQTPWEVVTLAGRDVTVERAGALAPDVVVHLAALTHPDECEAEPDRAREANVELTRRLAQGTRGSCRLFVYASTDLVFDGERGRYSEADEPHPVCTYGETKLEGERVAREEAGARAFVVRLPLLYGPRRDSGGRPSFAESMIERARAGETVSLYQDQFRAPLYVEDAAESLARLIAEPPSMPLLHLGGSERCSRYEMGVIAFRALGIPLELARAACMADHPTLATRPKDVSLDSAQARALALPARGLREGFLGFRDRMKRP